MHSKISRTWFFLLVSFLLLVILFPLSHSINFMQNDDWLWYFQVESFKLGNFTLNPLVASTFYLQGLFGVIFSNIWTISHLPILTLFFSVLCFHLFSLFIHKYFKLSVFQTITVALLFYLAPICIYSIWGFMTEYYFLFFYLGGILFAMKFLDKNTVRNFFLFSIFVILAFFIKQFALTLPLALGLYLILKRNFRWGSAVLGLFLSLLVYYYLFFPKTQEMLSDKSLQMGNLLNVPYGYSLLFVLVIMLCAFALPLIFSLRGVRLSVRSVLTFVGVLALLWILHQVFFSTAYFEFDTFPYLGNTFSRSGYFPFGIGGTKHHFPLYMKVFDGWFILALAGFSWAVATMGRKLITLNLFGILLLIDFGLLLVTPVVYDRYLVPVLPVFILWLVSLGEVNKKRLTQMSWIAIVLMVFLNYQLTLDFISTNRLVWSESERLVVEEGLSENMIGGNSAWRNYYGTTKDKERYLFNYDGTKTVHQDIDPNLSLRAKYRLNFFGSFFIDPVMHLWERPSP